MDRLHGDIALVADPPVSRLPDLIKVGPSAMARRLPGCAIDGSPRFCAARLAVTDLDATGRVLTNDGVAFEVIDGVLLIAPAASHGLALEFVEQETI